jgi:serine/threonine protein kinase
MTQAGQLLGTPAFMSPEQLMGGAVDARSDVFSLGAVLYYLCTGEKPFTGDTLTTVSFKILSATLIPARQLNPSLPAGLETILGRCMVKDPARRYQSGKELAADLDNVREGRAPLSQTVASAETESSLERTVLSTPVESLATGRPAAPLPPRQQPIVQVLSKSIHLAKRAKAIAVICLVLLVAWRVVLGHSSTLHIVCRHNFRSGELSVWVDSHLASRAKLTGQVKTRLGLFQTVEGSFSDSIRLTTGKHVLRVRVTASVEEYDQTQQIEGEFTGHGERTLAISCNGRTGNLYLDLR